MARERGLGMEGRTRGEGKGWRGEQVARERGGGENKWRGKGGEGRTSGEGKGWRGEQLEGERGGWGMKTEEISDLILTDNPLLVSGCSLQD